MRHSYSSFSTYKQCPAKYRYSYLDKLPRSPMGPGAERGTRIHDSVDKFMQGKAEELDPEIHTQYGMWLYGIRTNYICEPEALFVIDRDWNFVEDGSEYAYVKGFMDLHTYKEDVEVNIYEWKTGKIYDEHEDQRFLYGTISLLMHPWADSVRVHGVYFDQKRSPASNGYSRDDLPFMIKEWDKRFKKMETDKHYSPNPSFKCKWCDFSKSKGGPCQF